MVTIDEDLHLINCRVRDGKQFKYFTAFRKKTKIPAKLLSVTKKKIQHRSI
jgi:hypothetical protein